MAAQPPKQLRRRTRRRGKTGDRQPIKKPPLIELPGNTYPDRRISMIHERLVGRFVMKWGAVEGIIQNLIWQMLSLDFEDGKAVTSRNDVQANIVRLRDIAPRHLAADHLKALFEVLDHVKDIQEDRNTIVHSQWITLRPIGLPAAMSLRWKVSEPDKVMSETFPPERMYSLISRADFCAASLDALLSLLETSPDTQTP